MGFVPFGYIPWIKDYIGGVNYPSVQTYKHANLSITTSYRDRAWNALSFMMDDFLRYYYYLPKVQELAERYVGHKLSPLLEIQRNVSILLVNTHSSFEPGIPFPSNVLQIAGMHAQAAKPITDEVMLYRNNRSVLIRN